MAAVVWCNTYLLHIFLFDLILGAMMLEPGIGVLPGSRRVLMKGQSESITIIFLTVESCYRLISLPFNQ